MWHHVYSLKDPLDPTADCPHVDCDKKRARRVMVNIWGSVTEYDLCEKHAEEWHGKRTDGIPLKEQ